MHFWIIIAASIVTYNKPLDLENVSNFTPVQWNNTAFVFSTEMDCEAGLYDIWKREGGRIHTSSSGNMRIIRGEEEGLGFYEVYDCTFVRVSK